jgi:hypothetical protein
MSLERRILSTARSDRSLMPKGTALFTEALLRYTLPTKRRAAASAILDRLRHQARLIAVSGRSIIFTSFWKEIRPTYQSV